MVGTTLAEIRRHIEGLASDEGDYYLVCARTGDRPVPADGLRFASRATARAAASATEHYRATLRRYDPRLPRYDLIVCEDAGPLADPAAAPTDASPSGRRDPAEWSLTDRVLGVEVSASDAIALAGVVGPDVAERLELAFPDQAKRPVRVDEPGGDR